MRVNAPEMWAIALVTVLAATVFVLSALALAPKSPPAPVAQHTGGFDFSTSSPEAPPKVSVSVVGDSYTGGSEMDSGDGHRWRDILNADGVYQVTSHHLGGTGYVWTRDVGDGPSNFVTRASEIEPDADVVMLFGSINDNAASYEEVRQAASEAFAAARSVNPNATYVVVGPASPEWPVPEGILNARDAVRDAAATEGLTFFDPIDDGWFETNPEYIGEDGTHPDDAGHAYLAENLKEILDQVTPS